MVQTPDVSLIRDDRTSCAQRVLDSLLNLFYPEACFLCEVPIARWKDCGICTDCWNKAVASQIFPPVCPSCGLPMPNFDPDREYLCGNCILNPPAFSGARSFGYYSGELAGLIQGLKFHNRRNLTGLLTSLLAVAFYSSWIRDAFDLVIPVPLHPKRRRERGYNQAGLLARSLARRIGIPFCGQALIRTRPTLPQIGLTDSRRLDNVHNAFHCRNIGKISGKRILLVDDVMTTGATASSASRALVKGGARRVSVLTLARTVVG